MNEIHLFSKYQKRYWIRFLLSIKLRQNDNMSRWIFFIVKWNTHLIGQQISWKCPISQNNVTFFNVLTVKSKMCVFFKLCIQTFKVCLFRFQQLICDPLNKFILNDIRTFFCWCSWIDRLWILVIDFSLLDKADKEKSICENYEIQTNKKINSINISLSPLFAHLKTFNTCTTYAIFAITHVMMFMFVFCCLCILLYCVFPSLSPPPHFFAHS